MSRARMEVRENGGSVAPPQRLRLAVTTNSKGQVELDLGRQGLVVLPAEVLQLSRIQVLRLPYNELDSLPAAISYLRGLKVLQVSHNLLTTLPETLVNCKHLVELDASGNRLQSLPRNLGCLLNLRSLKLGENELEQLPHEMGMLASLNQLDLHQNKLWFLPFTLENLHKLSALNLSGNLFDQVPIPVCKLASLCALNLSHNRLAGLPTDFEGLRNLTELNLANNHFTSVSSLVLRLRKLKYLNVANNRLRMLPKQMGQLRNLRVLHAHGNQLEQMAEAFEQLQYLNVAHNQLTAFSVAGMPRLVCLNATHNSLEIPPQGLYNLRNLKFLRLEHNALRFVSEDIGKMGQLQNLDLSDNKLTSLPDAIYRLPKMHTFNIRGNNIDNRQTKATETETDEELNDRSTRAASSKDRSTLTSTSRLFKSRPAASAHSKKIQTSREVKVRSRHQGTQVMRRSWTLTESDRPRDRFSLSSLFSSLRRRNSQKRRNREQMMRPPRPQNGSAEGRAPSLQSLDPKGSQSKGNLTGYSSLKPSRRLDKFPSHETIRTKSSLRFEDEVDFHEEDHKVTKKGGTSALRSHSHYDLNMARSDVHKSLPDKMVNGGPGHRTTARAEEVEVEYDTDEAQATFSEEVDSHSTLSSQSHESLSDPEEPSQKYVLTSTRISSPVHSSPCTPRPPRHRTVNSHKEEAMEPPENGRLETSGGRSKTAAAAAGGAGGGGELEGAAADYSLLGVCSQLETMFSQQLLQPVLNFNGSIGKKFSEKTIKETANGMWRLQAPLAGERGRGGDFSLMVTPMETFTISSLGGRYTSHHSPSLSIFVPPSAVADTVNASLKTITLPPSLLALARQRSRFIENIVSMGPIVLLATASKIQFNSPSTVTIPTPPPHRDRHLVVLTIRADNSCVPCTGGQQLSRESVTFNAWHFSGKVALLTRAKCKYKACKSMELLLRAIGMGASTDSHKVKL